MFSGELFEQCAWKRLIFNWYDQIWRKLSALKLNKIQSRCDVQWNQDWAKHINWSTKHQIQISRINWIPLNTTICKSHLKQYHIEEIKSVQKTWTCERALSCEWNGKMQVCNKVFISQIGFSIQLKSLILHSKCAQDYILLASRVITQASGTHRARYEDGLGE